MRQFIAITAAFVVLFSLSFGLQAIGIDEGRVRIKGAIINPPCSIDAGDRVQSIQMSTIPIHAIVQRNIGSAEEDLKIKLKDCQLDDSVAQSTQQYFQIVFEGGSESNDFDLAGEAEGIALRITDKSGHIVSPGKPVNYKLQDKNTTLGFKINISGNSQQLQAGHYYAAIKFHISYH